MSRIVTTFSLLFLAQAIYSATISVPADQPTIQAGIDSALAGDTVLVAPGTYRGEGNRDMSFSGKAIVVMSFTGPEETIIDCEGDSVNSNSYHRAFSFTNDEDSMSVLQGFTVQNGVHEMGGAIYISGSSPTISDCVFRNNVAVCLLGDCERWLYSGGSGGAIFIWLGSPKIQKCILSDNSASRAGGGLCATYVDPCHTPPCPTIPDFSPVLESCEFVNNFVGYTIEVPPWTIQRGSGGGAYLNVRGPVTVSSSVFYDNSCLGDGGGLNVAAERLSIANCLLQGNSAPWGRGGGMYLYTWGTIRVAGIIGDSVIACNFLDNSALLYGGGLDHAFSGILVDSCLFTGNSAKYGGALHGDATESIYEEFRASVQNSTFANNLADSAGAAIHYFSPSPGNVHNSIIAYNRNSTAIGVDSGDFTCTNLFGNEGGDWVGGIADQADSNGNFSYDPLFCDTASGNYYLKEGSPCSPGNNSCGKLIGALVEQCIYTDVSINDLSVLPDGLTLNQNYPNPFNPVTRIDYSIPSVSFVKLNIYNIKGQLVTTLVNGKQGAGDHSVQWDASELASGVYLYKLEVGEFTESKKMVLLK